MTAALRTILHLDMDAFYVSVELRRHPELVGQPVVVGGTGPRGVVAAASYEARRFGVYSAVPSAVARRLCPSAVFLPGDHALYAEVSGQVRKILDEITPVIEPLALDEAFLDITGAQRLFGTPRQIAERLRRRIRTELGLGCSVGIAGNKFVAKLASKAAKPTIGRAGVSEGPGIVEVLAGTELDFLHPLAVSALWGAGPATVERLGQMGVTTVGDLAQIARPVLRAKLGATNGAHLHDLAWGIDQRPVEADRHAKTVSHEETFSTDRFDLVELVSVLVRLANGVAGRLRAQSLSARTITLKVRFAGFETITRSVTSPSSVDTAHQIVEFARPLLAQIDLSSGIRLLGVGVTGFRAVPEQLTFDEPAAVAPAWRAAETSMDAVRDRFGPGSIGPASAVSGGVRGGLTPGAHPWGPNRQSSS